jgi:hypothetical protein
MFDRQRFIEGLRAEDPHGHQSNSKLEYLADIEALDYRIADIEDISDVKSILFSITDLIRRT